MNERRKDQVPPPVFSGDPEKELEKRLQRNPHDCDAKVDVGSDESMDASDPPSVARAGGDDEPAPSSGYREEDEER